jgi:hypothetical protein
MSASSNESVLSRLGRLDPLAPDRAHARRIRRQCHLALNPSHQGKATDSGQAVARIVEAAVLGAFSLVYLVIVAQHALAMYGAP